MEDTAFYRYYPLGALAEVGGEPHGSGVSVQEFHSRNRERAQSFPHGLSATATHDTKRGEDTRARLLVLAELPHQWSEAVERWRGLLAEHRQSWNGSGEAPSPAEEYLIFQTLIGTWPPGGAAGQADYVERIRNYVGKALLEAKVNTSWINRNESYEAVVWRYLEAALDPERGRAFLEDFSRFFALVYRPGIYTALSQLLLKLAAPGVPDVYQGTELWDLSLVDPDNRRPVDWDRRRERLEALSAEGERDPVGLAERLLSKPDDGGIKLYLLSRALRFRRARDELFARGGYQGLPTTGARGDQVVAFARALGEQASITVVGRHYVRLCEGDGRPLGPAWQDTAVALPQALAGRRFRDVFTGRVLGTREGSLAAAEVFTHLPVALLEAI